MILPSLFSALKVYLDSLTSITQSCAAAAAVIFWVLAAGYLTFFILDWTKKLRLCTATVTTLLAVLAPVFFGASLIELIAGAAGGGIFGFFAALPLMFLALGAIIYAFVKTAALPLDKKQKGFELRSKEHNHLLSARRMAVSGIITTSLFAVSEIVLLVLFITSNLDAIAMVAMGLYVIVILAFFTCGLSFIFLPMFICGTLAVISDSVIIYTGLMMIIATGFLFAYVLLLSACIRTAVYGLKEKKALKICMIIFGIIPVTNFVFAIIALVYGKKKLAVLENTDIPEVIEINN